MYYVIDSTLFFGFQSFWTAFMAEKSKLVNLNEIFFKIEKKIGIFQIE